MLISASTSLVFFPVSFQPFSQSCCYLPMSVSIAMLTSASNSFLVSSPVCFHYFSRLNCSLRISVSIEAVAMLTSANSFLVFCFRFKPNNWLLKKRIVRGFSAWYHSRGVSSICHHGERVHINIPRDLRPKHGVCLASASPRRPHILFLCVTRVVFFLHVSIPPPSWPAPLIISNKMIFQEKSKPTSHQNNVLALDYWSRPGRRSLVCFALSPCQQTNSSHRLFSCKFILWESPQR